MKPTSEQIAKLPKWAQAHVAELQQRVTHLEGLPETLDLVVPDLLPPTAGYGRDNLIRGWDFNLHHLKDRMGGLGSAVQKYCSSSVYHGSGWDKTSSQHTRTLYSTERKAWKAAKAAFVQWAAGLVKEVDQKIKEASDEPYNQ